MKSFNKYIYILLCENDCYYIGQTNSLKERILQHQNLNGEGATWTSLHNPIECIDKIEIKKSLSNKAFSDEDKVTLQYINKFGAEKVRGGRYVDTKIESHLDRLKRYNKIINDEYVPRANELQIERYLYAREKLEDLNPIRNGAYFYILLLENKKYYIGWSCNIRQEVKRHFYSCQSRWTSKYKAIELVDVYEARFFDGNKEIDEITLKYFTKFGVENVRGGSFLNLDVGVVKNQLSTKYPEFNMDKNYKPISKEKLLKSKEVIDILTLLLEGATPLTGETLDDGPFLMKEKIHTSLSRAVEAFKNSGNHNIEKCGLARLGMMYPIINDNSLKSHQIDERKKHSRAYEKWTTEEIHWLRQFLYLKKDIKFLSEAFNRSEKAIIGRLGELGIIL
jgi:predicted GIY-YIG superfamily endonuclease